ncbi:glutaredoxin [Orobanche minor]
MGSPFSSNQRREDTEMALEKAKQIVASNPVVVFSTHILHYRTRWGQLVPIVFGDRLAGVDVSNDKFPVKMVKFTGYWSEENKPNQTKPSLCPTMCDRLYGYGISIQLYAGLSYLISSISSYVVGPLLKSPSNWTAQLFFGLNQTPSSKTWCGYCAEVKELLSKLQATYKLIELDEESDGAEIQRALEEMTGQRTVPNVFIGGKHIGGSDVVAEKNAKGELVSLLDAAGAIQKQSAQM